MKVKMVWLIVLKGYPELMVVISVVRSQLKKRVKLLKVRAYTIFTSVMKA